MRMEFKNPEILISLFSPEDIVTTSNGNTADAVGAIRSKAGDGATVNTLTADFKNLSFTEMGD